MLQFALLFLLFLSSLANVHIYAPDQLRSEFQNKYQHGLIPFTLANFGNPPYGSSIVGRVFVPRAEDDPRGCDPLYPLDWTNDPDVVNSPILLLERGDCPFAMKARNAQNIGAAALIVIDNIEEDVTRVIMADNGSGGNISIPVLMIGKLDGEVIKRYLATPQYAIRVSMALTFDMIDTGDSVNYDIWMSSEMENLRVFLHDFSELALKFKEGEINLAPHFVMWYSTISKDANFTITHPDCLSGGRYCAPDPDYDGPNSGRDIIYENLRQLCIYKGTSRKPNPNLWWQYVSAFYETCPQDEFGQRCSEKAMEKVNIKPKDIDKCVRSSFEGKDETLADNTFLREEKFGMIEKGVIFYPAIYINNQNFRGDLEADELMDALCSGFTNKPNACIEWQRRFEDNQEGTTKRRRRHRGMSVLTLILLMGTMAGLLALVLYLYRRWVRQEMAQEMKRQVNSAVGQYFALNDSLSRELES
jgi:hypothetical protein